MSLLQEVPDLSEEEKAVAEGDRDTLNKLIEKYKDVAPPPIPNERYIFNPTALPSSRGKMLPVIPLSKESSSSTETKHVVEVNRGVAARLPQPLVSQ